MRQQVRYMSMNWYGQELCDLAGELTEICLPTMGLGHGQLCMLLLDGWTHILHLVSL